MPRIRDDYTVSEMKKRWAAVDALAEKCGFDSNALEATESCLLSFFDHIVEECAKIAEEQGRSFSGEKNEMAGCNAAATAIRAYGKTINK